jgi:hypothetical protein
LCDLGYSVIAWFLVFIPIIMMTLVSTLLLKVFGTDPDKHDLRSKLKIRGTDLSNIYQDSDGKYYSEKDNIENNASNILNQQKYAYYYDRFNSVERIDRDKERRKLYNKIDDYYDLSGTLSFDDEDIIDLSNSRIRANYRLTDRLLNYVGDSYFMNKIMKIADIYYLKNKLSGPYNPDIGTGAYPGTVARAYPGMGTGAYPGMGTGAYSRTSLVRDIRADNLEGTDFESYQKKYDETYGLDGILLFKQSKYASVKDSFPNATDAELDKEIEKLWNNLTSTAKDAWNTQAQDENDEDEDEENSLYDYDPDNWSTARYRSQAYPSYRSNQRKYSNNQSCPVNMTPNEFKRRTGYECFEPCAPGKERNSVGRCISSNPPCPPGQERKYQGDTCRDI